MMLLIEIGGPAQGLGAFGDRRIPDGGILDRFAGLGLVGLDHFANLAVVDRRIEYLVGGAAGHGADDDRRGAPELFGKGRALRYIIVHVVAIGQIPAARVDTFRPVQVAGLHNFRLARLPIGRQCLERIGRYLFGSDSMVGELVDEGGIGTVFEQTADEIGEQLAMFADRGIDARTYFFIAQQGIVQCLAHAVQSLEFEILIVTRHLQNCRDAVGVVGGKLRVDAIGHVQQLRGAANIADVGR